MAACIYPTGDVFAPSPPYHRHQAAGNEPIDESVQAQTVLDVPVLTVELIVRERYVARVANHVDGVWVAMVEILVGFDDSRVGRLLQGPVRLRGGVGNQLLDIGEIDRSIGIDEVGEQEPCPGVSGSGIGHNECIVAPYRKIAASQVSP